MKQFDYTVREENGIHARPAGLLVREARKYASDVLIVCKGKSADLKHMFSVMGLGIKKGDPITITVSGEDEAAATPVLEQLIKSNL